MLQVLRENHLKLYKKRTATEISSNTSANFISGYLTVTKIIYSCAKVLNKNVISDVRNAIYNSVHEDY